MKKHAIVTGGAGFIGSHLVDALCDDGWTVGVIDNLSSGKKENVNAQARLFVLDIRDVAIADVFRTIQPEVVFHLAAQKSVQKSHEDPMEDAHINILGTVNILEACVEYKVRRFIFSSTGGAIYGDTAIIPTPEETPERPLSPYGLAKLAADSYLTHYQRNHELECVSLRYANVYGPRQDPEGEAGVIAIFIQKLLQSNQPVINGDGKQTRDFVYVGDIVTANMLAVDGAPGVYNVGTEKEYSINALFSTIVSTGKFSAEEQHGPGLSGEVMRSCLSSAKIRQTLGWQPKTDLVKGITTTIEWFRNK